MRRRLTCNLKNPSHEKTPYMYFEVRLLDVSNGNGNEIVFQQITLLEASLALVRVLMIGAMPASDEDGKPTKRPLLSRVLRSLVSIRCCLKFVVCLHLCVLSSARHELLMKKAVVCCQCSGLTQAPGRKKDRKGTLRFNLPARHRSVLPHLQVHLRQDHTLFRKSACLCTKGRYPHAGVCSPSCTVLNSMLDSMNERGSPLVP